MAPTFRTVTTSDGLALHVADYAPFSRFSDSGLAATPLGLPVVCLHGLTRNSRDFDDLAPFIANLGRRVVSFDMRGRGRSQYAADPLSYQPPVYADDVQRGLDALGIDRAVFVGTSMGGLITMVLNLLHPGRVAAVILNDVGPELDPAGLARIAGYVGKTNTVFATWDEAAQAIKQINSAAFPDRDAAFWLVFARRTCRQEDHGIVLDYDGQIAQAFALPDPASKQAPAPQVDLWPIYEGLAKACPTLIVRGALSDLLSRATRDKMVEVCPGTRAVEVPGVGHAPTLNEPAALEAICDFLAQAP